MLPLDQPQHTNLEAEFAHELDLLFLVGRHAFIRLLHLDEAPAAVPAAGATSEEKEVGNSRAMLGRQHGMAVDERRELPGGARRDKRSDDVGARCVKPGFGQINLPARA